MSQQLTSLERESELKAIVINNDLFEKKSEHIKRQRDSIASKIRHFETASSQLNLMATISEEERRKMKDNMEKRQPETHSFVQESIAFLNSGFEKLDASRATRRTLDVDNPALFITLPYDEWIQRTDKKMENLRVEFASLLENDASLETGREDMQRRVDVVSKSIGKAEKDTTSLKEAIVCQEGGMESIQKATADNQKKIQEATNEKAEEEKQKANAEEEIVAAEKIANELRTADQEKKEKDEKTNSQLSKLNDLLGKFSESTEFNPLLVSELPDDDEINAITDEWGAFNSTRKELAASLPELNADVSDDDTMESVLLDLENIRKQNLDLQAEIEEANDCKKKFTFVDELMARKKSGYDAAVKQVEQNQTILNNLRNDAAKSLGEYTKTKSRQQKETDALRQLEASNQDIPKGPVYKPVLDDFTTPRGAIPDTMPIGNGKNPIQVLKQSSIESDFTRQINASGPHYPGIQVFSQETKKAESKALLENKVPEKDAEEDSLNDSSIRMDDSGTTQDESMMNGFFSPLKNDVPVARKPSPVVEFSMADHINDFNKRQAEKKNATDTVNPKRFRSEVLFDDDDDADSSLIARDPNPEAANHSDDEAEDEDDDDLDFDDDDLMASDSYKDLNQSDWGNDD